MTTITVYQCDGCGYEVRDVLPETWRQDVAGDGFSVLDFCESCFRDLDKLEQEG